MNGERLNLDRRTFVRCAQAIRRFGRSEVGGKARWRFALLVALMLGINGLNVVNSYVGRDFMTAIEQQNMAAFVRQTVLYIVVFAVLTLAAVFYRFTEERLALLWRGSVTRGMLTFYLDAHTYYRLREAGEIENPDQRIAEDARAFTTTTLSFALMFLNASFTIIAFAGVMWSISPLLFGVAIAYAFIGSVLTIVLGRPLIWLNYNQSDKEAAFRADLVHVAENAESIAMLRYEGRLSARLLRHFGELVNNAARIIAVNRNLGFFTTGYNYLIQIIPALIVAPLFIHGRVEFGVIPQAAMAFSQLLGAFSLIVNQFPSISSWTAVLSRLSALIDMAEQQREPATPPFEVVEDDDRMAFEGLTLRSPREGRVLIENLNLVVPRGTHALILGANEAAKIALFRVVAGTWETGEGRLTRPRRDLIRFLPERPYLPPGTLRQVLVPVGGERPSDEKILATLNALQLEPVVRRIGGIEVERDWDESLSLGEQQLFTIARAVIAAPRFILLDRVFTALGPAEVDLALRILSENSISYMNFVRGSDVLDGHDLVLNLAVDGSWTSAPISRTSSVS